jgi:hypothetical protein
VGLGLFYLNYLSAFVVATLRADAVLHARLLAIRAESWLRNLQGIVRAPLAAAGF